MKHLEQIQAVENRVFDLRITMSHALSLAKVSPSTWSRAKARGTIRASTLRRVEEALDWYENRDQVGSS